MITKQHITDCYLFLRENNQSIPSEVLEFIKGAALEKLDKINSDDTPTITAGCYCTDIETEEQYNETVKAMIKLGGKDEGDCDYESYGDQFALVFDVRDGEVWNAITHLGSATNLVSHRDVIKAAKDL